MNFLRFSLIAPALFSGLLFPLLSKAETVEAYVVTASRFEQEINQVGSDVTIISAEEIREKQITSLADAIRYIPGLRISQTANGAASIFARGSKSDSVLILIDGIPVTDATGLGVDASLFYLANADKVEVVLGAQSALYGANALSGVINIVTQKGEGDLNGSILIGAGVPTQGLIQANINAGDEDVSFALGLNAQQTNLFSSTNRKSSSYQSDFDEANEVGFNSNLSINLSDNFSLSTSALADYQTLQYDDTWASNGNDLHSQYIRTFFNVKPELVLFDGFWTQALNIGYTNINRQYIDGDTDQYRSHSLYADWQHKFELGIHNIALGTSYKFDEQLASYTTWGSKPEKDFETYSAYAEYSVNPFDTFYITLAGRLDKGESYKDIEPSGTLALAYTLNATQTLFHSSFGRSFRAPSVVQYTDNNNIKPEHAYIFDLGLSQPLFDNALEVSLMYYNANYTDMIYYRYVGGRTIPVNIEEMDAQGVELGIYANPIDALSLSLVATYQDTKDHSTKKRQPKQADLQLAFDVDYLLPIEAKDIYVGASVTYVGDRDDSAYAPITYSPSPVKLDAYTLVDLRASIYLQDNLKLNAKINNIFNEEYEETYAYNTLGINGFMSLEYTF